MSQWEGNWAGHIWAASLPGLVLAVFVLLLVVPAPVPTALIPDFVLILVFLSATYRINVFPIWLAFLLGLLADVLGGTPPGLQAAIFIGVHAFARAGHGQSGPLLFLWAAFGLLVVAATLFRWAMMSGYYQVWLDPLPLITNMALTTAAFPLAAPGLRWLIGGEHIAHRRS